MSFNLKPQGSTTQHSSNAPQIDWNAINKQVETDNHTAVISQIVVFILLHYQLILRNQPS